MLYERTARTARRFGVAITPEGRDTDDKRRRTITRVYGSGWNARRAIEAAIMHNLLCWPGGVNWQEQCIVQLNWGGTVRVAGRGIAQPI
jgi:hypothetical protein